MFWRKALHFVIISALLVGGFSAALAAGESKSFSKIPITKQSDATILTINVDNIDDGNPDGGCTLREAIDAVNASLGPGPTGYGCTVTMNGTGAPISYEINLPSYTYTLSGAAGEDNNTSGDLDITASYSVTINGIGAESTVIDGGSIDRVFHIPSGSGISVIISDLTIQNGRVTGSNRGGGIHHKSAANLTIMDSTISDNFAEDGGGGIYILNAGTVTIEKSVINGNETNILGGGVAISNSPVNINNSTISNNIAGQGGGGILSYWGSTTLNISNSTIISNSVTDNTQTYFRGGGISINGENMVYITNSTISGNISSEHGGGISAWSGTTTLTNVTITNNMADNDNNGNGDGGGVYVDDGSVSIKNTILAGNNDRSGDGPDCYGTFTSLGYNLIGKNLGCMASFPFGNPNVNNDLVGSGPFPIDPLLNALTGNPAYHPLQQESLAVDAIPDTECSITTDQRGVTRPQGSGCDIGAYEYIPPNLPPVAVDDDGTGFTTDEDTPFTTASVLTNDSDPDGDILAVESFDTTGTKGQVTDKGDGTFDYDPDGQFEDLEVGDQETDTFTYTVSDGNGGTDTATVTITITGVQDGSLLYLPLVAR